MATMVTSTKTVTKKGIGSGSKFPGSNGKKPGSNGWNGGDGPGKKFSAGKYKLTIRIVLASIVMMFAALSSAYVFLSSSVERQPVRMPRMFFLSTVIILASSWTFTRAKRAVAQGQTRKQRNWLGVTLLLGLIFLTSQLIGWRELAGAGVYFAGTPNSSFFYLFTGFHGTHLLGGIALLLFLFIRTRRKKLAEDLEGNQIWTSVVGLYWHTMDGLWLWLFGLLLIVK